ncbi:MAG: hypothetical protein VCC19_05310 [Myxococcota bacterium]
MNPGPSQWIVGIGLLVTVAVFWVSRIWLPGTEIGLLTSDVFLYYLPTYETLYGTLLEGKLPLWNPYQLCGIPRLASLQAGFFYPGHVLYLLLPVKLAFGLSGFLHLGFVAVSMAVLARRLGFGVGAIVVAAGVVAIRGRYPGMVFFPNMLEAAAWLPLGAIAVLGVVRGGGLRSAALLGASTGMSLLAGYPQVSVYLAYGWGALLAGFLVVERKPAAAWLQCGGLFALAIGLGACLAAVQLLPGWELAAEGTRSPGPLTRWQQFPFGWFGPGVGEAFAKTLQAPFPLLTLSFGWVALVCLAAASFWKAHRVLAILCSSMAAGVILFAMGPVTPLFDWIAQLPALTWFRFPRRSLFLADFFLGLVAAAGVHGALRLVGERFVDAASPTRGWAVAVPAALLALEIFAAEPNRESLYFAPSSMDAYSQERDFYTRIRESGERAWIRSPGLQSRLPPKLATYFEMRSVGDYEPLNLRRQANYFTYLMEGRLTPARAGRPYSGRLKHLTAPTYPGALSQRGHLLDVAAVQWFVVSRQGAQRGELGRTVEERAWQPEPGSDPDFVLFRNPHAVPRAFVVHDVREAPEPLALMDAMSNPDFDPLAWSYAEGVAAVDGPKPYGAPAHILVDEETVVEVEAELAEPGMLVLADSFYPGWVATVEGVRHEILPANHLFRGVLLPAGTHRVRFEYDPWTFPVGAGASACALVAIAFLVRRGQRGPELPASSRSDSIPADD